MKHELKTDHLVFDAVFAGLKTHEIRLNDRCFAVGEELLLRETKFTGAEMKDGAPLEFTGREVTKVVSHVLTGYGLQDGWCILSFEQNQQLSVQNAELAATVSEFLPKVAKVCSYLNDGELKTNGLAADVRALRDLLSVSPQQHLRDVRAGAGKQGWDACVDWLVENSSADLFTEGEADQTREIGDQYAERVKSGEK